MSVIIALAALCFLMLAAYRGYSVILFAPVAALGAVLLTDPAMVAPVFYRPLHGQDGRLRQALLPVFLLGASSAS
jgi:H+/gluconate symporter-like permease